MATLTTALIVLGPIVRSAPAAPGDMLLRLHSDDVAPGASMFGEAIAAVGDDLVIGAPLTHDVEPFTGRAYLFDGISGALKLTIPAPDKFYSASFGAAIAGGNGVFAVGAMGFHQTYVFDDATGELIRRLTPPPGSLGTTFGSGIAFLGEQVLVAARAQWIRDGTRQIPGIGAAHLYDAITGEFILTLRNREPDTVQNFGHSIATLDGKLLVGTPRAKNESGRSIGRVYIFNGTTSQLLFTLENPVEERSATGFNGFGESLATLGNRIIVGAPETPLPDGLPPGGVVHVFDGDSGELVMSIPNPDPYLSRSFGQAVASVGNNILVGANLHDVDGVNSAGSVYLFDGATGELLLTIDNPERRSSGFGGAVTALGNNIVVGAPFDAADGTLFGFGAVYVFEGVPDIPVGDTDADGDVDIDDLNAVRNHFGRMGPDDGSLLGDTWPYDGAVGIDDLNRIRNYFGTTRHPPVPVPEPCTLALVALVATVALISKRRTWNKGSYKV